jgi:hypothetical protein
MRVHVVDTKFQTAKIEHNHWLTTLKINYALHISINSGVIKAENSEQIHT